MVAVDIDRNDDAQAVRDHIDRNDFAGLFVVAPLEMTEMLTDEFGTVIVIPPRTPKILLNSAQTDADLFTGVKSAEELLAIAEDTR